MIEEDYVSFEVAKLLKEKGFDKECNKVIHQDTKNEYYFGNYTDDIKGRLLLVPTLQMAMKWLRKVHNLCLFVIPATVDETFRTGYALYPQCDSRWEWCASKNDRSEATFGFNINKKYCDSHEEACEAVIKYCLEYLI